FYVPRICSGEAYFCIGMSEPESGSDLASVRTRAERTPTGWRLNGSKLWTTYGHKAHYTIALVRSSPPVGNVRSAGLSQVLIDLSLPGVTRRAIRDLAGDEHFSELHFDDVELPPDALIGAEGEGWAQVNAELAFERSGPERIYSSMVLVESWLRHCRQQGGGSDARLEALGHITAWLTVLRSLSLALTAKLARGESPA